MTARELVRVFLAALATALATGLGALSFVFAHQLERGWLGRANAVPSRVMLGASASLLLEATGKSFARSGAGSRIECSRRMTEGTPPLA